MSERDRERGVRRARVEARPRHKPTEKIRTFDPDATEPPFEVPMTQGRAEPEPPRKASPKQRALPPTLELDALSETSTAAVLIGYQGPHHDDVFKIQPGETLIGRSPECGVVLEDPYASHEALRIVAQHGEFAIENLSGRPAELNERSLVEGETLADGDLIKVGVSVFSFRTTRPT